MKNDFVYGSMDKYRVISLKMIFVLIIFLMVSSTVEASDDDSDDATVLDVTLNMLCFPPSNPLNTPPCPVPVGLDPSLIAPDPGGVLNIRVREDDTAKFTMNLDGLREGMVVTAWFVHYPPNISPPHPVFAPIGPGLPSVAHADSPLTPTTARFSEGLSTEPNQFRVKENGSARLKVELDYNPLKSGQVPLVNNMRQVNQVIAPVGSGAEQPACCPDFPAGPLPEPIGSSFLRKFDPVTGAQMKDGNGRPVLVRSPIRPIAVAIIVHIDGTTSGIVPGVPTPPFLVNPPATTGTFYLLGLFPLAALGMD